MAVACVVGELLSEKVREEGEKKNSQKKRKSVQRF